MNGKTKAENQNNKNKKGKEYKIENCILCLIPKM